MTAKKTKPEIKSLYYITHLENLRSILTHGILSHNAVETSGVKFRTVYDTGIVNSRKLRQTPDSRSLWDFANLYFQPRNPMLYRLVQEKDRKEIIVLGVLPNVLKIPGIFITDGNAANSPTGFYLSDEGIKAIFGIWDILTGEWWNATDGSKRKIMAECLVPGFIPPDAVHTIYVADYMVAEQIRQILPKDIPVVPEPNMFFMPARRYRISRNLSLAEGDMFFSNMQTLTVSVNTVGVMGKGLASRAKYQFPDVYVIYQDVCRKKLLTMGKPYLYKREASFDEELTEEPGTVTSPNAVKWFLMFATKRHWREDSDLEGIEKGLVWLADNYQAEGIKSLAMPALGCGLGKLEWKDAGPVMCRHLLSIDIPAVIYLPRERQIPDHFLSGEYLTGKRPC